MNFDNVKNTIMGKAVLSAYLVLSGPWFILSLLNIYVLVRRPNAEGVNWAIMLAAFIGLLWALWLNGFRICLTPEQLEYRDGFYRKKVILLNTIKTVKNTWIELKFLGKGWSAPRCIITNNCNNTELILNIKPFDKKTIHLVLNILKNKAEVNYTHQPERLKREKGLSA